MRLAAIDLGTNTVRLLVVEAERAGAWEVLEQDQRVTRLGEGLGAAGALGEAPMARTRAVVEEYVRRARRWGASRVQIVGTSAVREAANGRAFAVALAAATGTPVEIVSGDDEARLMIRGVLEGLGLRAGRLLIFDIGGGSTEYVLARDGAVEAAVSLRLGVVALAERYPFPEGVDGDRYAALEGEIRERLARGLPPAIGAAPIDRLVGTAGTVTTLAALDLRLAAYDARRVQGHVLSRDAVRRLLRRLGGLSLAERAALPCLEPGRADLIVPGTAIVAATMAHVGAEALVVSDWGLREGMMAEAIERLA